MSHRSIRFPAELEALVEEVAAREGRSFSQVVLRTLEAALSGELPSGASAPAEGNPPREGAPKPAASPPTPGPTSTNIDPVMLGWRRGPRRPGKPVPKLK